MAPTWASPGLFSFSADNLTLDGPLFLQFFHLFNFDKISSTKPESVGSILALNHKFFMLPKVQVRPKGAPFEFFSALCDFFSKIIEFYQRVPPCIFLSFQFVKNV